MSSIDQAFTDYLDYLDSIGLTLGSRLGPPATDDELAQLDDHLEGELPLDLRRWFQLCNGINLDHPDTTTNESTYLFPWLRPQSLTYLLGIVDLTAQRFSMDYEVGSPSRLDGPAPTRPFPVILSPETTSGMWMECAASANPGRLIYVGDLEDGKYFDGYYHESLADFVTGCLTNLRDGRFVIVDGGISVPYSEPPHDPFRSPINFWAIGFQKQDGLPPRLPWPTSYYDHYDIDVARPAGASKTRTA